MTKEDVNEMSMPEVEETDPPQKPNEELKTLEDDDEYFDEFTPSERSIEDLDNVRNKTELGYSTANYRTSLIPKVKYKSIDMKKHKRLNNQADFDKIIMNYVKTLEPNKVPDVLLKEVSRINTQIIAAK